MMTKQMQIEVNANAWDAVLNDEKGPAAIVIRECLRPAAGLGFPVTPPTFAPKGEYHYDGEDPTQWASVLKAVAEGRIVNRCTLDSIPSQANRMESGLKRFEGRYIPKVTLTGTKCGSMSLLDIGHRVADAALWSADGYDDFQNGLEAYVRGNALSLAKAAPTSLVFGYWDSRGTTGAKARRLIRGEIFAENVVKLTRRSQYWASVDPEASEDLRSALAEAKAKAKGNDEKNVASQLGFLDAFPSTPPGGGVIVHGDIVRLTILSLTGLRNLKAPAENPAENGAKANGRGDSVDDTTKMHRYLFALMLASASTPHGGWDLREGCMLVQRRSKTKTGGEEVEVPEVEAKHVFSDGREEDWRPPAADEVEAYLGATVCDLFGKQFPGEKTLTFNAKTAAERVREKLQEKGKPAAAKAGAEGSQSNRRGKRAAGA